MLADSDFTIVRTGSLNPGLLPSSASYYKVLEFIESELPAWRDREDRPYAEAEDDLTDQLCAHLIGAARVPGWDFLHFRKETRDEVNAGRKYDLVVAPSVAIITVAGRRHTEFDVLIPIECKRLPTPRGDDRDEREYLYSAKKTTGGVQRFKAGHHAAKHEVAGMIAYVQQPDVSGWNETITTWVDGLLKEGIPGWSLEDHLKLEVHDTTQRVGRLRSTHIREKGLHPIKLHHMWIELEASNSEDGDVTFSNSNA